MVYIHTYNKNGEKIEKNFEDMVFYSRCPVCNAESKIDFYGLFVEGDMTDTNISAFCSDRCVKKWKATHKQVKQHG